MTPPATRTVLSAALLAGILSLFSLLKLYALHPVAGDENIYYYLAGRLADGLVPYRDFVFAHPPMHIATLAIIDLASGGSFIVMKAASSVFILLTGLTLWLVARRTPLGEGRSGAFWPLLPVAFFLLNYDVLRASSHCTGANQATLFLIAGLALFRWDHSRAAGTAFACAVATATYVLPAVFLVFLLFYPMRRGGTRESRRPYIEAIAASAIAFVVIHAPIWLLAGGEWWRQTVLFHGKKPPVGSTFQEAFHEFMSAEGFLAAASIAFIAMAVSRKTTDRSAWLPAVGLAYLAALVPFGRIYVYYLLPASPFVALGGALFLREIGPRVFGRKASRAPAATLLAGILLVQPVAYLTMPAVRRDPGRVKEYQFRPTPGIGPVNTIISLVFPTRRIVGLPVPGFMRYLWHESRFWEGARELAGRIDDDLPHGATLYGDSTTTPLLAYLTGRRIAGELADTNTMQFRTGMRAIRDDLARAREDNLGMIVIQSRRGIGGMAEMARFIQEEGILRHEEPVGGRTLSLFSLRNP